MFVALSIYFFVKKNFDIFMDTLKKDTFKFCVNYYFKHCYIILIHLNFDESIKLIERKKNEKSNY